jgi:hypothetical protein
VASTADFLPTLKAALDGKGVHLVVVPIDYSENMRVLHRRDHAVDQKAGHAIIDQLGHRSPVAGNDRRSAGQRFHHRQAKRLVEIDEVKQRARGAQVFARAAPPTGPR